MLFFPICSSSSGSCDAGLRWKPSSSPAHPAQRPAEHPGQHECSCSRCSAAGTCRSAGRRVRSAAAGRRRTLQLTVWFVSSSGPGERLHPGDDGSHPDQPWSPAEAPPLPPQRRELTAERRGDPDHPELAAVPAGRTRPGHGRFFICLVWFWLWFLSDFSPWVCSAALWLRGSSARWWISSVCQLKLWTLPTGEVG